MQSFPYDRSKAVERAAKYITLSLEPENSEILLRTFTGGGATELVSRLSSLPDTTAQLTMLIDEGYLTVFEITRFLGDLHDNDKFEVKPGDFIAYTLNPDSNLFPCNMDALSIVTRVEQHQTTKIIKTTSRYGTDHAPWCLPRKSTIIQTTYPRARVYALLVNTDKV